MKDFDNPVFQKLRTYPQYADAPDPWESFKGGFLCKSAEERVQDIWSVAAWMDQESRISQRAASLLNAKRELEDIHQMMRKAGR